MDMYRTAQTVGFIFGGVLLNLAALFVYKGVMFWPSGGARYGPPRAWSAMPIESPFVQIGGAICLFCAGTLLFVLAYQNSRHGEKKER
jgi:hypothetical protein